MNAPPYARSVGALVGILVVVVVASVIVGNVAAPHDEDFDWEVASIFGTALGTTLFALVTGLLAFSTWQDVRASQLFAKRQRISSNFPASRTGSRSRTTRSGRAAF